METSEYIAKGGQVVLFEGMTNVTASISSTAIEIVPLAGLDLSNTFIEAVWIPSTSANLPTPQLTSTGISVIYPGGASGTHANRVLHWRVIQDKAIKNIIRGVTQHANPRDPSGDTLDTGGNWVSVHTIPNVDINKAVIRLVQSFDKSLYSFTGHMLGAWQLGYFLNSTTFCVPWTTNNGGGTISYQILEY